MRDLTTAEFQDAIKNGKVLLDFWAQWCGPCKMVAPVLEELQKENTDVQIFKIDVDAEPELAAEYSIRSIPTILALKDGVVVDKRVGAFPKMVYQGILTKLQ